MQVWRRFQQPTPSTTPPAPSGDRICARDHKGREFEFKTDGKCFEGQVAQVKSALESMPQFLDVFSTGLSTAEGTEPPVTVHFTNPETFEKDLKDHGHDEARITRLREKKFVGFYDECNNEVWLMTGAWRSPQTPLTLTAVARHEFGHGIDDFLEQRTVNGKELGFFSDNCGSAFTRHWQKGIKRAGVSEEEINLLNQHYNRLVREIKPATVPVLSDDEARDQMNGIAQRLNNSFVSTYAASGYTIDTFSPSGIFVEFFAEGVEAALDKTEWQNLYKRDRNFYAAMDQLLHYQDRGLTLAEAKIRVFEALNAPWTDVGFIPDAPPRYFIVAEGDNLSRIGQRVGVSWRQLAEFNRIKNPDHIMPGQLLKIPDSAGVTVAPKR